MIEQSLKESLIAIFDFKKTSFDAPADGPDQECLFIEMDKIHSDVKDNIIKGKVEGKLSVIAQSDKLPASYFQEKIQAADNSLTKDLFFHEFTSQPTEVNLVKRGVSFVYFFAGQYNPHNDNIESIEITGLQ